MERLLEILESLKRTSHFINDDDGFYSCPLSENGWYDEITTKRVCNCGLDKHNAKIEEAIEIVKRLETVLYGD